MYALTNADAYKYGHVFQYPENTEYVYSNWTPRKFRLNVDSAVVLGLQPFLYNLIEKFDTWFKLSFDQAMLGYTKRYVFPMLGEHSIKHWRKLHNLGYLPLKFYALLEGESVPANVPMLVVTNTHPDFGWLVNFIETWMSAELWGPSTSATIAREFRRLGIKWAKKFYGDNADLGFIDWQFHDFSMRGMYGIEAASLSGMGHLTQFNGTDSTCALPFIEYYYGLENVVFGSVGASEHSTMCAGGKDGEFETFDRLVNKIYPEGIVSVVSDTWDLWKVCTEYIPRLKESILNRKGKVVLRPDSSFKDQTPADIICGDPRRSSYEEKQGVLRLLAQALGTKDGLINNCGVIYGDGISLDVANDTLDRTINQLGLSPYNVVFGVGSYTYQMNTRDTLGFAMKATAVVINGELVEIYKDPVTDDGYKKSHRGIVTVVEGKNGYEAVQQCKPEDLDNCAFKVVSENGVLTLHQEFHEVIKRARIYEN